MDHQKLDQSLVNHGILSIGFTASLPFVTAVFATYCYLLDPPSDIRSIAEFVYFCIIQLFPPIYSVVGIFRGVRHWKQVKHAKLCAILSLLSFLIGTIWYIAFVIALY